MFRADAISARLEDLLAHWRGAPPRVLHNDAPDLAVARGAVAFALVRAGRAGLGPGIGGGSARSYFLVLEEGGEAARAICVLPRGTESGTEVALPERRFALRLGQAVRFHLVSSTSDSAWQAGELVELAADDFIHLPPLATRLPATAAGRRENVTVRLVACLTEVGTLEMQCVAIDDDAQRWQLAFQVRAEAEAPATEAAAGAHPRLAQAIALIDEVFGGQARELDAKAVRQLRARLERVLGRRDDWDMALLRALFDALLERARRRRRSAEHERVWLNLAGWCLRPGVGAELDGWRMELNAHGRVASGNEVVDHAVPPVARIVHKLHLAALPARDILGGPGCNVRGPLVPHHLGPERHEPLTREDDCAIPAKTRHVDPQPPL